MSLSMKSGPYVSTDPNPPVPGSHSRVPDIRPEARLRGPIGAYQPAVKVSLESGNRKAPGMHLLPVLMLVGRLSDACIIVPTTSFSTCPIAH